MSKIAGEKYEDFKSEEYLYEPNLLDSLFDLFIDTGKTKEERAHDNIDEIIESLPGYKSFKGERYIDYDKMKDWAYEQGYKFGQGDNKISNMVELLDIVPDSLKTTIARIGRVADAPYPYEKREFTDIYRILNPDSTINIQAISSLMPPSAPLETFEDKRVKASRISFDKLIKLLDENPDIPSITKNQLAKIIGTDYPRTYLEEEFYLGGTPTEGRFINKYPVKENKYPFLP